MRHLNSNLLCAVDINITGPNHNIHELLEIAIIPLNNFMEPKGSMFHALIKPGRIERGKPGVTDMKYNEAVESGIDFFAAANLFETWFTSLKLPDNKKICILSYKYHLKFPFIEDWLQPTSYATHFSEDIRDLDTFACAANDFADIKCVDWPFPKRDLGYIYSMCGYPCVPTDDCLERAHMMSQCYKQMLRMYP